MTLRNIVLDLTALNRLLEENPYLLSNIEIVLFSATILVYREDKEETVSFKKKSFAVTTTFHLSLESQIEAWLCEEYRIAKFIKEVKIDRKKF
jgi:hypothetical protein